MPKLLCEQGDTTLVEESTYVGALGMEYVEFGTAHARSFKNTGVAQRLADRMLAHGPH